MIGQTQQVTHLYKGYCIVHPQILPTAIKFFLNGVYALEYEACDWLSAAQCKGTYHFLSFAIQIMVICYSEPLTSMEPKGSFLFSLSSLFLVFLPLLR